MNITERFNVINPWVYINENENATTGYTDVILNNNGDDVIPGYLPVTQLCFGMSLMWLKTRKTKFSGLEIAEKKEVITNVLNNIDNADQIKNGKILIGNGTEIQTSNIGSLPVGTRFLIFGLTHVRAAIKTSNGYIIFDSNYGSETTYDLAGFINAVAGCHLIAS